MGRIAVGLDGSAAADTALRWAVRLAEGAHAGIIAIHAFRNPWSEMRPESHDRLVAEREEALRGSWLEPAVAAGVDAEGVIRSGDPRDVILDAAVEIGADMLVLGRTGAGTGPGLFHIGSVAEHAAHHSPLPVAVIPAGAPPAFHRIVVGVDGSAPSRRALEWAGGVAARLGSEVVVVQVMESTDGSTSDVVEENWQHVVERDLAAWSASSIEAGVSVVPLALRDLRPADALLGVAGAKRCDLVVVGLRGLGGFSGLRAGGVALKVLHQAGLPLVLVPPDTV